jgi:hypothetical protein
MRRFLVPLLALAVLCSSAYADEGIVMFWPRKDNAIMKLTFSRFQTWETMAGG